MDSSACPTCGRPLAPGGSGQRCSHCMLRAGLQDAFEPALGEDAGVAVLEGAVEEQAGRYRTLGEHARGGMGRILLVHDVYLGRDVALKELAPEASLEVADPSTPIRRTTGFLSRFLQEARITGQLEHPAIVPVYELGVRPDGTLYYTMKLVRGRTLREALASCATLADRLRLLPHFLDLCQAIAYAHSRGVIHRDLKPDNVMVGEFGETVVLDWGLAKSRIQEDVHAGGVVEAIQALRIGAGEGVRQTEYGEVIGTPAYMSPEQAQGRMQDVDERSDVYALGAVLYEILAGDPPFRGETANEVLQRAAEGRPEPLDAKRIPIELAAICCKAMSRDPADRYATARGLAEDIERYQSGTMVQAHRYTLSGYSRLIWRRHRPLLLTAGAALMLLVLVTVLYFFRLSASNRALVVAHDNAEEFIDRLEYFRDIASAQAHVSRGEFDAARRILSAAPDAHRNWEWGYLMAAANPPGITLYGHKGPVTRAEYSVDGEHIITASEDGTVRLWEAATGHERVAIQAADRDELFAAALSPDGKRIISLTKAGPSPTVWDGASGERLLSLEGHENRIAHAGFSRDGSRILTASWDGTARVWDASSGEQLLSMQAHDRVHYAEETPDGSGLVTMGDVAVKVWAMPMGDERYVKHGFDNRATSAVFSPDGGRVLTAAQDGVAKVWDTVTGRVQYDLRGPPGALTGAWFNQDGSTIIAAADNNVLVAWDAASGQELGTLADVQTGALNRDSTFGRGVVVVRASSDEVALVDLDTLEEVQTFQGHNGPVLVARFSPDGTQVLTASADGTARVWPVGRAAPSPPVETFTSRWDSEARQFRIAVEGRGELAGGPTHAVTFASFNADRARLVAASWDGTARIWNVETGEELYVFRGHEATVHGALFSPDGKALVTYSEDQTARIWDMETGQERQILRGHEAAVVQASYRLDGRALVTASYDHTARVWNAEAGLEQVVLRGHAGAVNAACFSADGGRVATVSSDGSARIWSVADGSEQIMIRELAGGNGIGVAFSPDGTRLLTSSPDSVAQLWDAESGTELCTLTDTASKASTASSGTSGPAPIARFLPDGRGIVSETWSRRLYTWSAAPWDAAAWAIPEQRLHMGSITLRLPAVPKIVEVREPAAIEPFLQTIAAIAREWRSAGSDTSYRALREQAGGGVLLGPGEDGVPLGPESLPGDSLCVSLDAAAITRLEDGAGILESFVDAVRGDPQGAHSIRLCTVRAYQHVDWTLRVSGGASARVTEDAIELDSETATDFGTPQANMASIERNESRVIEVLHAIVRVQQANYNASGVYTPDFYHIEDRVPINVIYGHKDRWFFRDGVVFIPQSGYELTMSANPGAFQVWATPERVGLTSNRHFFVDQTGIIRTSADSEAGPESPPIAAPDAEMRQDEQYVTLSGARAVSIFGQICVALEGEIDFRRQDGEPDRCPNGFPVARDLPFLKDLGLRQWDWITAVDGDSINTCAELQTSFAAALRTLQGGQGLTQVIAVSRERGVLTRIHLKIEVP
jgi:WD40 repeat protein/serine/threonine protein kinase